MSAIGRYVRQHHIALLALFVALGGTSYAAISLPAYSVGTRQIKSRAVSTSKIATSAVRTSNLGTRSVTNAKLATSAVTSSKVNDDSLLGSDILESSLGKVPAAAAADNATSAENATTAATATNAENATNALTAANANALGGAGPGAYAAKAGNEPFHLVNAPGEPAFQPGWSNYGPAGQTAGFYKDQFGVVHLRGQIKRTSGTSVNIFFLPVGYRPTGTESFAAFGAFGTAAGVTVSAVDGAVVYAGGDTALMGLGGITFRTTD